jgi:hypothetical protein
MFDLPVAAGHNRRPISNKTSPRAFSISPGQGQLFDEKFTFPHPLSDSVDAQILECHNQGATRDMIGSLRNVGPNRVSRVLNFPGSSPMASTRWKRTIQESNEGHPRFH